LTGKKVQVKFDTPISAGAPNGVFQFCNFLGISLLHGVAAFSYAVFLVAKTDFIQQLVNVTIAALIRRVPASNSKFLRGVVGALYRVGLAIIGRRGLLACPDQRQGAEQRNRH